MGYSIRRTLFLLALGVSFNSFADSNSQKQKNLDGAWFASGIYSINIANNGATYSKIGAMGGYLGNWGGYLKLAWDLVGNKTPNIVGGFTKRLSTFRSSDRTPHSALYIYFGAGCGNVEHAYFDYKHEYTPIDGGWYPTADPEVSSWDGGTQVMVDTGLIYRYRHLNFNLGYSITPDLGFLSGGGADSPNHSIQFGIGYTF